MPPLKEQARPFSGLTWGFVVGVTRIELVASSVSGKRSPAELYARMLPHLRRLRILAEAGLLETPLLKESHYRRKLEATPGFEPGVKALQASALPLGHVATWLKKASRRFVSAGSSCNGADNGIRTRDPHLGKVMLYQLSHVRVQESIIRIPYRGARTNLHSPKPNTSCSQRRKPPMASLPKVLEIFRVPLHAPGLGYEKGPRGVLGNSGVGGGI